ncbi:MAG: hypothetical protein ACYDHA_06420 [Bellilinea sp.]
MITPDRSGLEIAPGWMNAAGFLGFAPPAEISSLPDAPVAFVTNPVSYSPRTPAAERGASAYPGGFILHTGWPNPGFRKVIEQYASRWAHAPLPVWVHLLADRPHEVDRMVRALEEVDGVAAVEISLPPAADDDLKLQLVEVALGELPLVLCVPLDQAAAGWVNQTVQAGISAICLSAPRGCIPDPGGGFIRGRMMGPGIFPQALQTLNCLWGYEIPLIAGCGVYTRNNLESLLSTGAAAVQLDAVLWRGWERD